jgi:serine/threonine protein kinase
MVKKVGKYELGRALGEGTFGKVKYATDTETNEAVAIKILDKEKIQKQNMGNQIKKEISIMKMVKHKYVVGMVEVLASKTKIFIVLELVTGGELFDKIVQVGKLNEDQARFYFNQLIEGVEFCHQMGVCHRDLKPENLLLDEHGNLKISDFGLSSLYIGDAEGETNRTELLHTTCGTPNYVAPEVLADCGYDGKKADVWSCGVILYVLLAGFLPFDESTIVALFAKIQTADFTYPHWFTTEVRALLDQMIIAAPKDRASLTQVRQDPWCMIGQDESGAAAAMGRSPAKANVTEAQLDAAFNHDNGDDYEDNEDDKKELITLNAFDLVSQCGGFMVDRMFCPEFFYTASAAPSTSDDIERDKRSFSSKVGGTVLFGQSSMTVRNKSSKSYHYSTSCNPQDMIKKVYDALREMNFTFADTRDTILQQCSLKADLLSAKGMVGVFIQVFFVSPTLSLIEIKRGKGDILEWNTAFTELMEKKIGQHMNTEPLKE